jgi:hypothetical protein
LAAKKLLTSSSVVRYFDPQLPTLVLTDASRLYGLGFALVQQSPDGNMRLVRAGSTSLSPTESRYATIELEMLAIKYAVEKCQFYLRGMQAPFKVVTDHRPLLGVFKKPLHDVENPRLQRLRGHLDGAGYVFEAEWTPGKEHLIADALSRSPVFRPDEDSGVDFRLLRVSASSLALFRDGAASAWYSACVKALRSGVACMDLPPSHPARSLRSIWNELSVHEEDGVSLLVLDGGRIFVPLDCRKDILQRLHASHSGIVKTRTLASQLYYWPGMSSEVKTMVETCEKCRLVLPSQADEPFLPRATPRVPMRAVGADLCEYAGKTWLVMVDRYSGFPCAARLRRTATADVTKVLLRWFLDWGFPRTIRTDGGPQFRREFGQFCDKWSIEHETSSPYNPQSNGLAEAAVKNVKRLIKKTSTEDEFFHSLFAFRNVPRADGFSPAQLFFGRRQRGVLPMLESSLGATDKEAATSARRSVREASAASHDEHSRLLPAFHVGQRVAVQDPKSSAWDKQADIVAVRYGHRSYDIRFCDSGAESTRNRRYLRPVQPDTPASASPTS